MELLIFFLVLAASWFVGVCAWAQIIGSLLSIRRMSLMRLFAITLWGGILAGSYFLVRAIADKYLMGWAIGVFIAFLSTIRSVGALKQEEAEKERRVEALMAEDNERKVNSFIREGQIKSKVETNQHRHRRSERWKNK